MYYGNQISAGPLLPKYAVEDGIDFFFACVGVNVEIIVSGEHCREAGAGFVVEDVYRDAAGFGIAKLITDSQRGGCAFGDDKVRFPQPGGVLLIDALVAVRFALVFAQGQVPDVLRKDNVRALNISDDALV